MGADKRLAPADQLVKVLAQHVVPFRDIGNGAELGHLRLKEAFETRDPCSDAGIFCLDVLVRVPGKAEAQIALAKTTQLGQSLFLQRVAEVDRNLSEQLDRHFIQGHGRLRAGVFGDGLLRGRLLLSRCLVLQLFHALVQSVLKILLFQLLGVGTDKQLAPADQLIKVLAQRVVLFRNVGDGAEAGHLCLEESFETRNSLPDTLLIVSIVSIV